MPSPFEFRLRPAVRRRLDQLGQEFQAEFLGRKARRAPDSVEVLVALARVLMDLGRNEESLAVHRRLAALIPRNPIIHYNLACSQAICQLPEEATASLHTAIEFGYDDVEFMQRDDDLASLRGTPAFEALAGELTHRNDETPSN